LILSLLCSIQNALQQVRHSCTDSQKKKYMDLFALADSESEPEESAPRKKGSHQGRGSASNNSGKSPGKLKTQQRNSGKRGVSDSSEDSSDNSEDNEKLAARSKRGGGARGGKNARKRTTNKVSSYKISSDESSDDDTGGGGGSSNAKKPPKKKRLTTANSDSD
jgi:hypothetical protein